MKKLLLLSTSLVLLGSGTSGVFAADLPMATKAPMLPPAVFSWTGCYLGAHVGGATSSGGNNSLNGEGSYYGYGQGTNGTGAIAGGQIGCNYQDGNWVFGLEGEGAWSGVKANNNNSEGYYALNQSMSNTSNFDIAARAGIAFDRTLIYGKGGWSWGKFGWGSSYNYSYPNDVYSYNYSQGTTLDGFLVGVGIEHALTRNWTIKLEYNYIAYGAKSSAITSSYLSSGYGSTGVYGSSSNSANLQVFKIGANYLFDIGH
jgi:outer membrane immunogenic protein